MRKLYWAFIIAILAAVLLFVGYDLYIRLFSSGLHFTKKTDVPERIKEFREYSLRSSPLYENSEFQFNFLYPAGFEVKEFPQEGEDTIIRIQHKEKNISFYLTIKPHSGDPSIITEADLQVLSPNTGIQDVQDVYIGNSGQGKGLAFVNTTKYPQKREIWFAFNGIAYNLTGDMDTDILLQEILSTWKFITQ